jgi:hypothetical protein
MTAVARIPFTPADEGVFRQMMHAMLAVAIFQVLFGLLFMGGGGLGFLASLGMDREHAFANSLVGAQMLAWVLLGLIFWVEGALVAQARSAFRDMVTSDTHDQELVSKAFHRLKFFFTLELVLFGVNLLSSIVGVVFVFVAPEEYLGGNTARDVVEAIRNARGER